MVDIALLGFAFSAGMAAFFSPCSFALLPAYISFVIGRNEQKEEAKSLFRRGMKGASFGVIVTLGFVSLFLTIGTLISLAGSGVRPHIPLLIVVSGIVLIALGIRWLLKPETKVLKCSPMQRRRGILSFYLFGIGYAIGAISCVFPLFMGIVLPVLSTGDLLSGILVFLSYALGMGIMMIVVSIAVTLSKDIFLKRLEWATRHIKRVSGIILLLVGIYLIYYWYVAFAG